MDQVTQDRIATTVYNHLAERDAGTLVLTPTVARLLSERLLEIQLAARRLGDSMASHSNGRQFAELMLTIRENAATARELVAESVDERFARSQQLELPL